MIKTNRENLGTVRESNTLVNKKESAITLIALVITIIVLIILAGVSINLILGNNGLIGKAKEGRQNYAIAANEEESQMANTEYEVGQANIGGASREETTDMVTRAEYNQLSSLVSTLNQKIEAIDNKPETFKNYDYSTDEKEIGTWIDGKTLYRKTFVYNTATSGSVAITMGTIENIDVGFIDGSASFYINNNINTGAVGASIFLHTSGRNVSTATYTSYSYVRADGQVIVLYGSTTASTKTVVTVCYTKKTTT